MEKTWEVIRELQRLDEKLQKAQGKDLFLVNSVTFDCAFTPKALLQEIVDGGWHAVNWQLWKPAEYFNEAIKRRDSAMKGFDSAMKVFTQERGT